MKTQVNNTNAVNIEAAFKNPFGMVISDKPEIRKAVADHAKSIIARLHANK